MKRTFAIPLFFFFFILILSCKHEPFAVPSGDNSEPPNPDDTGLCFDRDILPIFVSQCAKSGCHSNDSHEGDYVLDSYENIVSKGITPGSAINSKIYKVLFKEPEDRMPKDAPPLTDIS